MATVDGKNPNPIIMNPLDRVKLSQRNEGFEQIRLKKTD